MNTVWVMRYGDRFIGVWAKAADAKKRAGDWEFGKGGEPLKWSHPDADVYTAGTYMITREEVR